MRTIGEIWRFVKDTFLNIKLFIVWSKVLFWLKVPKTCKVIKKITKLNFAQVFVSNLLFPILKECIFSSFTLALSFGFTIFFNHIPFLSFSYVFYLSVYKFLCVKLLCLFIAKCHYRINYWHISCELQGQHSSVLAHWLSVGGNNCSNPGGGE